MTEELPPEIIAEIRKVRVPRSKLARFRRYSAKMQELFPKVPVEQRDMLSRELTRHLRV
jgi:hypothetical protein